MKVLFFLVILNCQKFYSQDIFCAFNIFKNAKIESSASFYFKLGNGNKEFDNPLIIGDNVWENLAAYLYGSVIYDSSNSIFRMWYRTISTIFPQTLLCFAESKDGLNWIKPHINQLLTYEYPKNNIILLPENENNIKNQLESCSILQKENLDSSFTLFYSDVPSKLTYPINESYLYMNYSYGGINWLPSSRKKLPLITDEVANVVYKYVNDSAIVLGRSIVGNRIPTIIKSKDLDNWTIPREIFSPTYLKSMNVVPYYLVASAIDKFLVGYLGIYNPQDSTIYPTLCYSSDNGTNWLLPNPHQESIKLGNIRSFDSKMIVVNSNPFIIVGNEIWTYYSGFNTPHGILQGKCGAIGLVKWNKKEFLGYGIGDSVGKFYISCIIDSEKLVMDAEINNNGFLQVEIADSLGNILPGFSNNNFRLLPSEDKYILTWNDKNDLSELIGHKTRLVFTGKNVTIFNINKIILFDCNSTDISYKQIVLSMEYKLYQNYPNPFNLSTKIEYYLPVNSFVTLTIYNILGEKIITLLNDEEKEGSHVFNLSPNIASGIYFYNIIATSASNPSKIYNNTKKLIFLK